MKPIADSTALIVGGTSGIELATARQLLAAGARAVTVAGRNDARGERALSHLRPFGDARFVRGDACRESDAEAIAVAAGAVDILICATAPAVLPVLFHTIPSGDIARTLADIAVPPMLMAAALLPGMRERRHGIIVNVASDAAKTATPGEAVIGAAMAAIVMFSRTLAMEAKRDNVRVNVLTPSLVAGTETSDRILASGFSARLFAKAGAMASLGVAEADDLAALAVFLASPVAAKITGQAISVNGGISAA